MEKVHSSCGGRYFDGDPIQTSDRCYFFKIKLTTLISKCNISKNTKMELTLVSYIKFNVESVP